MSDLHLTPGTDLARASELMRDLLGYSDERIAEVLHASNQLSYSAACAACRRKGGPCRAGDVEQITLPTATGVPTDPARLDTDAAPASGAASACPSGLPGCDGTWCH